MIVCVFINMVTYLLPISTSLGITTDSEYYGEGSFPKIAMLMGWGEWLGYIMLGGALTSIFGVYQVYLLTSSLALYSLSLTGDAPRAFSYTFPKMKTPWVALAFFSLTTAVWCLLDFSMVVEIETILYCIHVCFLFGTFFKLRYSHPGMVRPYKIPGSLPVLIIASFFPIAVAITNMSVAGWTEQLFTVGVITLLGISFWIKRQFQDNTTQLRI